VITENVLICSDGPSEAAARSAIVNVARGTLLARNRFGGAWNNVVTTRADGQVTTPDVSEHIFLDSPTRVENLRFHSMDMVGNGIAWIEILDRGSGYSAAETVVLIAGGGGSGAAATAIVHEPSGTIMAIAVTSFGRDYESPPRVIIRGNGSGARAVAQWKLPLPRNRELAITCMQTQTFARAGPQRINGAFDGDIVVPTSGTIRLRSSDAWFVEGI
jgi:hypothetical protein